jgi:ribosomal protein S6--L-glutamate ligase
MILSFHPIIEAHQNIICAGRDPNEADLAAIQAAEAVILPQGCSEALFRMAWMNCPYVFPDLSARFKYPGKCDQIRLFQNLGLAYPETQTYDHVAQFHPSKLGIDFPAVVKLDWGGQGETVFKVDSASELSQVLERVAAFEQSGQSGFLIQRFIPTHHRCLRVALIHTQTIIYWRIQKPDHPFGTSVAKGAAIDHNVNQEVKAAVQPMVQRLRHSTGLQLAGLDYIFDSTDFRTGRLKPLILEINYFFGRSGLGGSEAYYRMLEDEVDKWLAGLGLKR